jgi:hypothetical protein
MSKNKSTSKKYINISAMNNSMLERMQEHDLLTNKQDAVRLAISIALALKPNESLSQVELQSFKKREGGVLNLNSKDIDEAGEITKLIALLTDDKTPSNTARMEELANMGLSYLRESLVDDDHNIDWNHIVESIK